MYMREGEAVVRRETWINLTAFASALGVLVLSFLPGPLFNWAAQAVMRVF
jgi:hypothetical protein